MKKELIQLIFQNFDKNEWFISNQSIENPNSIEGCKITIRSLLNNRTIEFQVRDGNLLMPQALPFEIKLNLTRGFREMMGKDLVIEDRITRRRLCEIISMAGAIEEMSELNLLKDSKGTLPFLNIPQTTMSRIFRNIHIKLYYDKANVTFSNLQIGDVVSVLGEITTSSQSFAKTRPCLVYALNPFTKRVYVCPITSSAKDFDRVDSPLIPFDQNCYFDKAKSLDKTYLFLSEARYIGTEEINKVIGHVEKDELRKYLDAINRYQRNIIHESLNSLNSKPRIIIENEEPESESPNIKQAEEQNEQQSPDLDNYAKQNNDSQLNDKFFDGEGKFTNESITLDKYIDEIKTHVIEILKTRYNIADFFSDIAFAKSGRLDDEFYHAVLNKWQKNRQKYPQIDIQINRFSIKLCVHTPKSMSHYIFDDELSNYLIKTMQKYIPDYYIYLTYHIISQAVKNNKGVSETKTYLSKLGLKYDGDIHKLMSDPNSLQPNLLSYDKSFYKDDEENE